MKKTKYFIGCDPFDDYKPKNIEKMFAPHLLPQPSQSDALIAMKWAMHASKAMEVKPGPSMIKIMEDPNLPDNVFYALSGNGVVERVTLEWDDKEKKNKVIVKKYDRESKKD